MSEGEFFQAKTQALDCRVCLEKLVDPRVLPCGHSFCGFESSIKCIQKLDNPHGIQCPICRTRHTIRSADLPPNYALRDVLDEAVCPQKPELCQKHWRHEIQLYCCTDQQKICFQCLGESHIGHEIELVGEWRKNRLTSFWNRVNCEEIQEKSRAREDFFKDMTDYLKEEYNREHTMAVKCNAIIEKEEDISRNFNSGNFVC